MGSMTSKPMKQYVCNLRTCYDLMEAEASCRQRIISEIRFAWPLA